MAVTEDIKKVCDLRNRRCPQHVSLRLTAKELEQIWASGTNYNSTEGMLSLESHDTSETVGRCTRAVGERSRSEARIWELSMGRLW